MKAQETTIDVLDPRFAITLPEDVGEDPRTTTFPPPASSFCYKCYIVRMVTCQYGKFRNSRILELIEIIIIDI